MTHRGSEHRKPPNNTIEALKGRLEILRYRSSLRVLVMIALCVALAGCGQHDMREVVQRQQQAEDEFKQDAVRFTKSAFEALGGVISNADEAWNGSKPWREKALAELRIAVNSAQATAQTTLPTPQAVVEPVPTSQAVAAPIPTPPIFELIPIDSPSTAPGIPPAVSTPLPKVIQPTAVPEAAPQPPSAPANNGENQDSSTIPERFANAGSLQEAMLILAEAKLAPEASNAILSAWYIDRLTTRFVNESQGRSINRDGEYGVQCVDTILVFLLDYFGTESPTFKGSKDGYPKEGFDVLRQKVEAPDEIKPSLPESIVNAAGWVKIELRPGYFVSYPYHVHLLNPGEASNLNPGDMLFLIGPNFAPSHTGIYLGADGDRMIVLDQNSRGFNDGFAINTYHQDTLYGAARIVVDFSNGSPDANG